MTGIIEYQKNSLINIYSVPIEFKHPIFWGSLFTKSYKNQFSVSDEELAIVSVKNHKQAKNNPNSLSNKTFSIEEVIKSKQITEDLRLLDCSRSCTGSASVILASEKMMKDMDTNKGAEREGVIG